MVLYWEECEEEKYLEASESAARYERASRRFYLTCLLRLEFNSVQNFLWLAGKSFQSNAEQLCSRALNNNICHSVLLKRVYAVECGFGDRRTCWMYLKVIPFLHIVCGLTRNLYLFPLMGLEGTIAVTVTLLRFSNWEISQAEFS